MQNAPDFKIELFNAFSQPVIFLQDGKVAYANHAAAACGVDASMDRTQVVWEEDGSVKLRLGDLLAPATCCDYLDGALYIADENWDGAHISTDTLLNVAQAMRTPLTDVFSVSTSLFSVLEEMEDSGISRSMARLNKSFYQLLRLMCDLTEMPAAMEGSLSVRLEKIELRAFMQELYTMAGSLCQTCKHTLTLSLPDKTIHVWADRSRLTRAIYNLIANAVRHTMESSVISLRLIRTDTVAIIEVHDPAEPGSRICDTTHASEDERYLQIVGADAGFGFAIARAVARAHGGTLIVGAGDDGGTTAAFSITLRAPDKKTQEFHLSRAKFDYTGGISQELIEMSDVLPIEVFDSVNVN